MNVIEFGKAAHMLHEDELWNKYYEEFVSDMTKELVSANVDADELKQMQLKLHFVMGFRPYLATLINRQKYAETCN